MKIEEISINTKEYPQNLQNIYNPPKKLYVLGNIQLLNKSSIAVVGARKATWYGKKVAFNISEELSCNGKVIISGLALGIDTYAQYLFQGFIILFSVALSSVARKYAIK